MPVSSCFGLVWQKHKSGFGSYLGTKTCAKGRFLGLIKNDIKMKELKISFKNEMYLISFILVRLLFFLALIILLNMSSYFYYAMIFMLLPSFYLHFKYLFNDQGKLVLLTEDKLFLVLNNLEVDLTEAKEVVFHGSVGLTRSVIPFLISPDYYNVIFKMEGGKEFSVSSLLDRKLKNYIYNRINKELIGYEYYMLY